MKRYFGIAVLIGLAIGLAACTAETRSRWIPFWSAVFDAGKPIADGSGIPGAGLAWGLLKEITLGVLGVGTVAAVKHAHSGLPGTEWGRVNREFRGAPRDQRLNVLADRRQRKKAKAEKPAAP